MNRIFIFIFIFSIGCSPVTSTSFLYSSQSLTENISPLMDSTHHHGLEDDTLSYLFNKINCPDFNNEIWNHVYITLFSNSPPPPPILVQKKIKQYTQDYLILHKGQPRMIREFSQKFTDFYRNTFQFFANKSEEVILQELADIEYLESVSHHTHESYISPQLIQFVKNSSNILQELKQIILPLNISCNRSSPSPSPTPQNTFLNTSSLLINMKKNLHPIVYGARKVMATAYQSCDALTLPLVPDNYSGVKGITQSSQPRRGGYTRNISSVNHVNKTHYYLQNNSSSQSCANISRNPLIYDYGGKPFVTHLPYPSINLFKNAGSGSKVLGIDCSGFVLSSLASAGLRIRRHQPMRGPQIAGVSSWTFRQNSSRLNCFKKINSSHPKVLLPGDVIAMYGHVLIVDQISADPLGLSKMQNISQCAVSKIPSNNFHFSIIQSSSNFNGIGINRVHILNAKNPKLITGLKQLASSACYKKFRKPVPNKNINITILRHTRSPECTENEVYLTGQECLASCTAPTKTTTSI